jgi:dimethylhistidine N-methyltransferase
VKHPGSTAPAAPSSLRTALLRDVRRGLRAQPKWLPSKYFYDERGSALFERICTLEEYYVTRAELAIMREAAAQMAQRLGPRCLLAELGSGSSVKTELLLEHLVEPAAYVPIDIAAEELARSAARIAQRYPQLDVRPLCADFTRSFSLPELSRAPARRAVYFPGSTIGNFEPPRAARLLRRIASLCGQSGGLLIGVDLRKDAGLLERAYNDADGVTSAFNLNLLARLNRELDADFQLDGFRHRAFYDRRHGRIEMHLVSARPQTVRIGGLRLEFAAGETIRTEYSYKYSLGGFRSLARQGGFGVEQVWLDRNRLFSVQYLSVAPPEDAAPGRTC